MAEQGKRVKVYEVPEPIRAPVVEPVKVPVRRP